MKYEEFKNIAITLKAAFPALKAFENDEGIRTWYEMLKDLDYAVASAAVSAYIRESPYPPAIAAIRTIRRMIVVPDWSIEWQTLLTHASFEELNAPAQSAVQTLTEAYVREMLDSRERVVLCMKEFERLYNNFFRLSRQDEEVLKKLGVWSNGIGFIQMQPKLLITEDGRELE